MEKKEKKIIRWIVIGVLLFLSLRHFDLLLRFLGYIGDLIFPIIIGLVVAFVLSVPTTGFKNLLERIFAGRKRKMGKKAIRIVSVLLTLVCVGLVLVLFGTLVIPELIKTVKNIAVLVQEHWPAWLDFLDTHNIDTTGIREWIAEFNIEKILQSLSTNTEVVIGSIADATSSTVSKITSVISGIIIAIYVLFGSEKLARHSKKVLYAYVKTPIADKICYISDLIKKSYTKFLTGQCLEAVILGFMIFVSYTVFRLPYAGLIGVVTAICALIPYIGAFISCGLSIVLALLISPKTALMCLVVYLIVQLIETQVIYPRVVGRSVGLPPLWTLLAFLLGGRLFGILGMIFFIPLVAVIYTLVRKDVNKRINVKKKSEKLPQEVLFNLENEGEEAENETQR